MTTRLTVRSRNPALDAVDAAPMRRRAELPTALVSMPFGPQTMPSIQIGLLAAIGRLAGFPVDTHHLNLEFAAQIGPTRYGAVAGQGSEVSNWVFSVEAFGSVAPDADATQLANIVASVADALGGTEKATVWLTHVRDELAGPYLDQLIDGVDWGRYRVVGFTVTYQQKTAAFALARRIKQRWPHVITLFGGANFDEPMGEAWMEAIPWIDVGVNGEADLAFPELLAALADGRPLAGIPGLMHRDPEGRVVVEASERAVEDLSWLPVPDFDEFFDRAERLGLLRKGEVRNVQLPFEAARGCWWGRRPIAPSAASPTRRFATAFARPGRSRQSSPPRPAGTGPSSSSTRI